MDILIVVYAIVWSAITGLIIGWMASRRTYIDKVHNFDYIIESKDYDIDTYKQQIDFYRQEVIDCERRRASLEKQLVENRRHYTEVIYSLIRRKEIK